KQFRITNLFNIKNETKTTTTSTPSSSPSYNKTPQFCLDSDLLQSRGHIHLGHEVLILRRFARHCRVVPAVCESGEEGVEEVGLEGLGGIERASLVDGV